MKLALTPFAAVVLLALSGCATDMIMDLGQGDSIKLVGQAESFDCDDPKYKNVKKIQTTQLRFADGTSMSLCMTPEDLAAAQQRKRPEVAYTADAKVITTGPPPKKRAPFRASLPDDPAAPVVHAIGVYQPQWGKTAIVVDVNDDSRPLLLVLNAYEKVHWTLNIKDGVRIERILLAGYHTQTISGMAQNVPVEVYTYIPSPCSQCTQGTGFFFDHEFPHARIKELAGQEVNTFQGSYESGRFTISTQQEPGQ